MQARAARSTERNGVFARQHARAFESLLGDDVAGEDFVILLQDGTQVFDQFFDLFYELRMDVRLYAADGVVGLDQASASGLFEDVEHLLAVAETVEEGRQRTHIHTETGEEEQVRIDTLQFVHDGADVLYAFRHLHVRVPSTMHMQSAWRFCEAPR